jgi:hypothetical protein
LIINEDRNVASLSLTDEELIQAVEDFKVDEF